MKRRRKYNVRHKGKVIETESILEQRFLREWLKQFPHLPPLTQHMFYDKRLWRFDFCWPPLKVALEIQGYGPGHTSRKSMYNDANKHNTASALGWSLIYLTGEHLKDNKIEGTIRYVYYLLTLKRQ